MVTSSTLVQSKRFKIGWITLLVISALAALNHIILAFVMVDEATLFMGWAAFNLYSTLVLWIPIRRGETWAWYASWILVIAFACLILFDSTIGVWYLGAAILMAAALLLTYPAFFRQR